MSCEDDQSECYELFEALKAKNVLSPIMIKSLEKEFEEFSEAYEEDERREMLYEILESISYDLLEAVRDNNITDIELGWYVTRNE